ncbi:MAG: AAA family ATPase [Deltaproteobacteria bacterium]|nr:AAA family ATPase [Deltaproteobacteria bacterium]
MKNNLRDGKRTVVIIDEAHAIQDMEIFEELRLLLNFQADDRFFLTLLLMGQPELREKIELNKQLAQRIAIGYHLQPLDAAETASYVHFRCTKAGGNPGIFTPEALVVIHSYSGGIPRRINQICDVSLLTGLEKQVKEITPEIVKAGVASLGL